LFHYTFYRTTNTKKSTEVDNTTKHNSTVKATEAQEDDRDETNVYEDMNYEIHEMSSCPAYDTININHP
jgi:hypothetical protein